MKPTLRLWKGSGGWHWAWYRNPLSNQPLQLNSGWTAGSRRDAKAAAHKQLKGYLR